MKKKESTRLRGHWTGFRLWLRPRWESHADWSLGGGPDSLGRGVRWRFCAMAAGRCSDEMFKGFTWPLSRARVKFFDYWAPELSLCIIILGWIQIIVLKYLVTVILVEWFNAVIGNNFITNQAIDWIIIVYTSFSLIIIILLMEFLSLINLIKTGTGFIANILACMNNCIVGDHYQWSLLCCSNLRTVQYFTLQHCRYR